MSFPPPGDIPDPGIKLMSPVSPALQADSLPAELREALESPLVHLIPKNVKIQRENQEFSLNNVRQRRHVLLEKLYN